VRLQTQLLLASTPLAAGLALLGFVSLRTVDELGRSSQRILQDNYRSVLAAQRMKEAAERIDSAAVFRAAGRPEKADQQAPPNLRKFEEELSVQEHNITEPGEEEATRQLREAWNDYQAAYQRFTMIRGAWARTTARSCSSLRSARWGLGCSRRSH
jgi:hypothetical protein